MSAAPVGLIDIGSNSIVLLVARRDDHGWHVLERRKKTARLGAAIEPNGELSAVAVKELEHVLREFCRLAEHLGARLTIAATASLRNVSNGTMIAKSLGQFLGHELRILSEREEAIFAFRGVWAAEARSEEPLVVVDVGGGSSEVAWGRAGHVEDFLSLPLGAVRLSTLQNGADPVEPAHLEAMVQAITDQLSKVLKEVPANPLVFACSGSIRRLCRIGSSDDPRLSISELDALVERLQGLPLRSDRLAIEGMDPDRVDVLLPAALIHQRLAARFGWQAFQLSSGGLRRGLLDAQ